MIKYIIFDFDGTIADTMPYTLKNLFKLLKEENIILPEKNILDDFKSHNFFELIKKWKISPLRVPFILKKIKKIQDDLYYEIATIKIFPEMEKLFMDLKNKGYKLGILSSNNQKNVERFLEINKLDCFDIVYCKSNFLAKDKAISSMLKKYDIKVEDIVYVGDEIRDVVACHKVGIKIIGVPWGLHTSEVLQKAGVDYLVGKPEEIFEMV